MYLVLWASGVVHGVIRINTRTIHDTRRNKETIFTRYICDYAFIWAVNGVYIK